MWSSDNRHIAFTDKDYSLYVYDTEKGLLKKVDTDLYANPDRSLLPVWSPDGKWVAYARRLPNQLRSIFVYDLTSGTTKAITDPLADHIELAWEEGS